MSLKQMGKLLINAVTVLKWDSNPLAYSDHMLLSHFPKKSSTKIFKYSFTDQLPYFQLADNILS